LYPDYGARPREVPSDQHQGITMSTLTHSYFGALSSDSLDSDTDVCWERTIPVNGIDVEAWLWIDRNAPLQAAQLDAFAALLSDMPALDARARVQLCRHLADDSGYLEFHVNELGETPVIAGLMKDSMGAMPSVNAFVERMQLRKIGLWHDSEETPLVLDYK